MEATSTGDGNPTARCVLWHRAGVDPGALESRLRQRGIDVAHVMSPYAALAELCVFSEANGRGGPTARPLSLILVEPASLGRAAEVVRAACRYAPGAVVWAFEGGARPELRPVTDSDLAAWGGPGSSDADDRESDMPVRPSRNGPARPLRLSGDAAETPHPSRAADMEPTRSETDDPAGKPVGVRHILTQEELAMLLAEEPGDPPRP